MLVRLTLSYLASLPALHAFVWGMLPRPTTNPTATVIDRFIKWFLRPCVAVSCRSGCFRPHHSPKSPSFAEIYDQSRPSHWYYCYYYDCYYFTTLAACWSPYWRLNLRIALPFSAPSSPGFRFAWARLECRLRPSCQDYLSPVPTWSAWWHLGLFTKCNWLTDPQQ